MAASTPAIRALTQAKVTHVVHSYPHDPRSDSYGDEAVAALSQRVGAVAEQIFKTLVVELSTGTMAVAVVPVPRSLSLKAVAAALGAPKAVMADKAKVQRMTGYVLGGVSPLGQKRVLPTVVDESALGWDRVLCSAGKRGLEIEVAPADLIRATTAVTANIGV